MKWQPHAQLKSGCSFGEIHISRSTNDGRNSLGSRTSGVTTTNNSAPTTTSAAHRAEHLADADQAAERRPLADRNLVRHHGGEAREHPVQTGLHEAPADR